MLIHLLGKGKSISSVVFEITWLNWISSKRSGKLSSKVLVSPESTTNNALPGDGLECRFQQRKEILQRKIGSSVKEMHY